MCLLNYDTAHYHMERYFEEDISIMRVLLLTNGGKGGIGGSEVFDMELIDYLQMKNFVAR